jgi:hypothetical protein
MHLSRYSPTEDNTTAAPLKARSRTVMVGLEMNALDEQRLLGAEVVSDLARKGIGGASDRGDVPGTISMIGSSLSGSDQVRAPSSQSVGVQCSRPPSRTIRPKPGKGMCVAASSARSSAACGNRRVRILAAAAGSASKAMGTTETSRDPNRLAMALAKPRSAGERRLEAMEGFDYGGEGFPERNSASASAF